MTLARLINGAFLTSLLTFLPACAHAQQPTRSQPPPPLRQTPRAPLVLRAARMLDVRRGELIADAVVIVEGDRITAAGSRLTVPAGARIIDLGDVTILPGLIDAHTHITY
ncbi:MAG: hypothetical protein ACJ741_02685, partial [Pyrinomonadaceae bacterium]